jgi:hypothetical protein
LRLVVAVEPDSQADAVRPEGEPLEVRVSLYGDHLDQLVDQLAPGVRVSLTGRLDFQGKTTTDTAKGAGLTMAAGTCEVLGPPSDQEPS